MKVKIHFSPYMRVLISFIAISLGVIVLLLRLVDLQVVQGANLRQLSEDNRFFTKTVPAERGIFFDRFSEQLVVNRPVYYHIENPAQIFSAEKIIAHDQAMEFMVASPAAVVRRTYRSYPFKSLSTVLGYVSAVTKQDLDLFEYLKPQDQVGKTGLENTEDRMIRGQDGQEVYELNAQGNILRKVSQRSPQAGQNVYLTVDAELTTFITEQMNKIKGAVIVGDPESGALLSLVSSPSFDANILTTPTYSQSESEQKTAQVQVFFSHPDQVFFNRAVSGTYPPGSIFKLVTALAGLEQQAFDTDTSVVDEGVLKVGDDEFGNWYFRQYGQVEGKLSVRRALARSNDIFFYKAAEWLGPQSLADSARLIGLQDLTGIELPNEAKGLIPDPAWKEKTLGEPWYLGNTYHFGIGQGDVLVTPIQVFMMTSIFANHGRRCQPHLIQRFEQGGKNSINCQELGYSQEYLDTVWEGMVDACSAGGTAFPFFDFNAGREQKVGCKTGTAEFGAADENGYRKTHGWFTMVTDIQSSVVSNQSSESNYPKKVTITVLVESDDEQPYKEGSVDAAPIALEILQWIESNR